MKVMTKEELLTSDLATLSNHIKEGKVSPVEVALHTLNRIEEVDPLVNSFITIDRQDVLIQAAKAEEEIKKGHYKGQLHGIPIGLKDLIYTENLKTTMGSEIFQDFIPAYNATVVEKLKAAGAIIIGKLSTHEFAYGSTGDRSHYGPVHNPHNLKKMSGGSSNGSAAAVSACLCYGSLGTDTGGSGRIPASFCGTVGMKPTFGRISMYGTFPVSDTLDHIALLTRSVKDNAILLNATAGYDSSDPFSLKKEAEDFTRELNKDIKGVKIGLPSTFYFEDLDKEVRRVIDETINTMEDMGVNFESIELPNIQRFSEAHRAILGSEAYAVHEQNLMDFPDRWDEEVRERLLSAVETKGFEYVQALHMRQLARDEFNSALEEVDAILTPTVPILPQDIGARHAAIEKYAGQHIRKLLTKFTAPTSLNGFPSLSLPCGFSQDDLPVGVQLIGKEYEEAKLYRIGHALEKKLALNTLKYRLQ